MRYLQLRPNMSHICLETLQFLILGQLQILSSAKIWPCGTWPNGLWLFLKPQLIASLFIQTKFLWIVFLVEAGGKGLRRLILKKKMNHPKTYDFYNVLIPGLLFTTNTRNIPFLLKILDWQYTKCLPKLYWRLLNRIIICFWVAGEITYLVEVCWFDWQAQWWAGNTRDVG